MEVELTENSKIRKIYRIVLIFIAVLIIIVLSMFMKLGFSVFENLESISADVMSIVFFLFIILISGLILFSFLLSRKLKRKTNE